MSLFGTSRHFAALHQFGSNQGEADIHRAPARNCGARAWRVPP